MDAARTLAHRTDPDTSASAARATRTTSYEIKTHILELLAGGPRAYWEIRDDYLAVATVNRWPVPASNDSIIKRACELNKRHGLLMDVGRTPGEYAKTAVVWALTRPLDEALGILREDAS